MKQAHPTTHHPTFEPNVPPLHRILSDFVAFTAGNSPVAQPEKNGIADAADAPPPGLGFD